MKILKKLAAVLAASGIVLGCTAYTPCARAADPVIFSGISGLPFENGDPFKGVDVSSVISLENSGVVFRDRSGKEQDLFVTLAEAGVNTVRVRIWNDPYDGTGANYGGGICDVDVAEQIARRCANAGLRLLIDFHYSDFWADPGKQKAPKAWQGYSVPQKAEAIYDFTRKTLTRLHQTGADIAMVQVGNETTTGMCGIMLADYNWSDAGWRDLCTLFNAGARAVRDFSAETLVALHFTNPEKADNMAYLAKMLAQNDVDYDVFATSYYPYWHGTLDNLTRVLTNISRTYGKQVLVAETSWAYTLEDTDKFGNTIGSADKLGDYVSYEVSAAGQSAYLHDLYAAVAAVPNGIGVFYWEPAWLPVGTDYNTNAQLWEHYGSGWGNRAAGDYDASARDYYGGSVIENEALFDTNGAPLDSLYIFGTVHGDGSSVRPQTDNLLQNPGFEADGGWSNSPRGWTLRATAGGHFDVRAEDTRSGSYALHWYSESPFAESTAETAVTVTEAGFYRCAIHIQADASTEYTLTVATTGGQRETVHGQGSGWADWHAPAVTLRAEAGEIVTMTLTVSGGAGSFGSVDDCEITRTENAAEEPVRGDLNGDGTADRLDLELLHRHLLTVQPMDTAQAAAADLTSDGILTAADAARLKQIILHP